MNEKTRVALADDHPIILTGLGNLIEAESDLELVGQATSGQSALKMIREKLPDVAIVDISMPELNGIVLARRLTEECPSVRILILTLYEERSFLKQAMAAGVRGYMTVWLADLADFAAFNEEYRRHFELGFPARSTVQATLYGGARIEIEAQALGPQVAAPEGGGS